MKLLLRKSFRFTWAKFSGPGQVSTSVKWKASDHVA